jgi:TetR/AcrR family transcriptional regulator
MSTQTRKERERAEHRLAILEAAEEVFAQKGFHSATVQEIAERAEFSVGYLYSHFEGKEELYVERVDLRISHYIAAVQAAVGRADGPVERVRAAIATIVECFRQREQFLGIFLRTSSSGGDGIAPGFPEKCLAKYRDYIMGLADVFAEGIKRGLFVDADPWMLVLCMDGMMHHGMQRYLVEGERLPDDVADVLQNIFLHGITVGENGS